MTDTEDIKVSAETPWSSDEGTYRVIHEATTKSVKGRKGRIEGEEDVDNQPASSTPTKGGTPPATDAQGR